MERLFSTETLDSVFMTDNFLYKNKNNLESKGMNESPSFIHNNHNFF